MPILNATELLEYLPHRKPFIMVSELLEHSETSAKATLHIDSENILVTGNSFSEAGLIEFMAQTLALQSGYTVKSKGEQTDKGGVIGAITNFEASKLPKIGETIYVSVVIKSKFLNMTLAEATVNDKNNQVIARGNLKTATSE